MTKLTRRQILIGGGALAASGLIPAIPRTPLTPQMRLMGDALAADIPRPDYMIRLMANENPYGPSRVALKAVRFTVVECVFVCCSSRHRLSIADRCSSQRACVVVTQ